MSAIIHSSSFVSHLISTSCLAGEASIILDKSAGVIAVAVDDAKKRVPTKVFANIVVIIYLKGKFVLYMCESFLAA